jgi:hypothetical protein
VSAVLAIGRKDVWQGLVGAFNVWLTELCRTKSQGGIVEPRRGILPTGQGMESLRRAGFCCC